MIKCCNKQNTSQVYNKILPNLNPITILLRLNPKLTEHFPNTKEKNPKASNLYPFTAQDPKIVDTSVCTWSLREAPNNIQLHTGCLA